jgi:hypothetical protein
MHVFRGITKTHSRTGLGHTLLLISRLQLCPTHSPLETIYVDILTVTGTKYFDRKANLILEYISHIGELSKVN